MPRATWRIMPARTMQPVAGDLGVGRDFLEGRG